MLKASGLLAKLQPHVQTLVGSRDAGLQSSCLQLLAELMPDASDKQAGIPDTLSMLLLLTRTHNATNIC